MAKIKTLEKPKKLPRKSMKINGIKLYEHNPEKLFQNHQEVRQALAEALLDGDKEAFIDILSGYVKSHNILDVCRRTGLSRTVVYEAIGENANPSLDTLCRIIISFQEPA